MTKRLCGVALVLRTRLQIADPHNRLGWMRPVDRQLARSGYGAAGLECFVEAEDLAGFDA